MFLSMLLFMLPLATFSQQYEHTLLWRISGKGMARPSYLYGTLHLREKRIFRFDDSMYAAIEHTDGLAIEVNLNEIIGCYINKLLDEQDDDKKISDVFSKEEISKLEEPLKKKFKKNVKDITTKDILKEKNKWMADYLEKGEMPTFIDAYLYDIARRQGKWMGGIEDVEDQISLPDLTEVKEAAATDETSTLEKMIRLYINQDLEGINQMVNKYDAASRDAVLTKRNIKMARRMDSLSAFRPMFFAVGAAHLPGDSGVIHLLRARGFTVEPVISHNRIDAKDYKFTEVPVQWEEVSDADNNYSVSMPGTPASIKMFGLIEMKFLLEFSNLSGYCTMAFINPVEDGKTDSLYDRLAATVFKDGVKRTPLKVTHDGTDGAEYVGKKENYSIRMQLFHQNNVTCMAWVYGKKDAYLHTADVDRFFESLKLHKSANNDGALYTFVDSIAGVTFKSPAKIELNPTLTKQTGAVKDWDVGFFTGQDKKSGAFLMLVTKQVKPGNVIFSDSAVLEEISDYFKEKYHVEKKWSTIDGYRALSMEGPAKDVYMKALTLVRGNKNIALLLVTQKKDEDQRLLSPLTTLRFIPYKRGLWRTEQDSLHTYSAIVPAPFTREYESANGVDAVNTYSFDTLSATSYYVVADTLNNYAWVANDSLFLRGKVNAYGASKDTILTFGMTRNYSDIGAEGLLHMGNTNVYKRIRILLHGNILYTLLAAGERAVLLSDDATKFFTSFKSLSPAAFDIHKRKCRELLNDLKSHDSTIRYNAYAALDNQEFEKEDLPLLHDAVFASYPPLVKDGIATATNVRIGNLLSKMADRSTMQYVKKQYPKLAAEREPLKYVALDILAAMETEESFNLLADLLLQSPPRTGNYFKLSGDVNSNVRLLAGIYPRLSKLISDTSIGLMVTAFTERLLDSGYTREAALQASENDILSLAAALLPGLMRETDINYGIYGLIGLLRRIGSEHSVKMLTEYLFVKNNYLRMRAALVLAGMDRPVPAQIMDSIAADPDMRLVLYRELKDINKEDIFPTQWHSQVYFAEAAIRNTATDVEDVVFIDADPSHEITIERNEKPLKFYTYKVTFLNGTDTVAYLGIAGAYDTSDTNMDQVESMTGIYYAEPFDPTKVEAMLMSYLSQFESEPPKEEIKN